MGFDFDKVIGDNKELLKCAICFDVVKNAVQVVGCEHLFCGQCMDLWMSRNGNQSPRAVDKCPVDRSRLTRRKIGKPPRIVSLLLDSLTINCRFAINGCQQICKLGEVDEHENGCQFRNEVLVFCVCGLRICRQDLSSHSCLRFLSQKIEFQNKKIIELQKEMQTMKTRINSMSANTANKRPKQMTKRKHSMTDSIKKRKRKKAICCTSC